MPTMYIFVKVSWMDAQLVIAIWFILPMVMREIIISIQFQLHSNNFIGSKSLQEIMAGGRPCKKYLPPFLSIFADSRTSCFSHGDK